MISSFGVTLCHAHGMMAVTAGQPGHCAFVVRPARGDPRQWLTRYYIQPFTGARFSVLGFGGYQSLLAGEELYTGTTIAAREHARWLGDVLNATMRREYFSRDAVAAYRRAMESAPGNWQAGDAWRRHLKASGAPQVRPHSLRPDTISGASVSTRAVDSAPPGALRAMKALMKSMSGATPAGRPSITPPIMGAWLWPKIVS